mgnify:CR=1 FL=1
MKSKTLLIKQRLSYYLSIFEFPKKPLSGLLSNYSDILKIINSNNKEI